MKALLFTLILCMYSPAYSLGGYVGAGIGLSDINLKSNTPDNLYDPAFTGSARVGFNFDDDFTLGLTTDAYLINKNYSNGSQYTFTVTPLLVEFNVYPMVGHTGVFFGLLAGVSLEAERIEVLGSATTASEEHLTYGGQAGWNFALTTSQRHTLAVQGRILQVDHDRPYTFLSSHVMYNFWW